VDGIGIVRDADTVASQLFAESYRPRTGHRRSFSQRAEPPGELLRSVDGGVPGALAAASIEGSEDLAPPAVENGERRTLPLRLLDPPPEGIERADPAQRHPEADAKAAGGGDSNPDPREGAGAETGRDQVDGVPAAGRSSRSLDLLQESGGVPGPPLRREAQLRLVDYLAVAPSTGDGVNRRGIETDDEQGRTTP
jgi:hypothetical protein